MERKTGIVIGLLVFSIAGLIIYFSLQPHEPVSVIPRLTQPEPSNGAADVLAIESFIGSTDRNGMRITAVWLPPIQMERQELPQHDNVIHLEADIHALAGNKNGFGLGAWIPYLTVTYEIRPVDSTSEPIRGEMLPMVAKDGPHYGATIEMPGEGDYQLIYRIDNPSKKGFGRHNDPITGVDPWWDLFEVSFDFKYGGSKEANTSAMSP
jgi:periplasmic iron binding protein